MLLQPWAHLVAVGIKTAETRTWKTPYRGPLAIGASKTNYDLKGDIYLRNRGIVFPPADQLVRGAVVATAHLSLIEPYRADLVPQGLFQFTEGERRFAWFLDDRRMLENPVPVRGQLGLFDIPWPPVEMASSGAGT